MGSLGGYIEFRLRALVLVPGPSSLHRMQFARGFLYGLLEQDVCFLRGLGVLGSEALRFSV